MLQEVIKMFEEKLNEIYSKIANTLNDVIPEDWDKVLMYGEISEGAEEVFFYYYPAGQDKPVYSHNIPEIFDISEDEYDELLLQLIDNITELQNELKNNGQEPWTNLTFILESNGKFKFEYDYTDLLEVDDIAHHAVWEYKYLGIIPENEYRRKFVEEYIKSVEDK